MIGKTISHYRILEKLGAGGMGEVYKAEDTRLHRFVAMKVMLAEAHRSEEARARFLREARAASALNHPNIATIYEIDEFERDGERHSFIVMEYVNGKTLSEHAREHKLGVAKSLEIVGQIADALSEAHQHGIVHRDIKPSNVIIADSVSSRGRAKVLDFGLARLVAVPTDSGDTASEFETDVRQTLPGTVMGTLAYMSPEQALGKDVDQRSDIFSLGVLTYELLAGKLPFEGRTSLAIAAGILHAEPPPLSQINSQVTPELEQIVRKMLEKERERRYQNLREVYADLEALQRQATMMLPSSVPSAAPVTDVDPFQTHVSYGTQSLGGARPGTRTLLARTGKIIAVMNFVNVTRNPDDDWLGVGMAETVTADLKSIEDVTVIGRELIYEVLRNLGADQKSDFDEKFATRVGREVGARFMVGGGYQRVGEMLRITARVVQVETGEVLSTVKIDGRLGELFELQDKIVYELARNLNLGLRSGEQAAIEQDDTQVMDAYEAFTKGMMEMRALSVAALDRAIAHFEEAVALDPQYARAYASLGYALELKGQFTTHPEFSERAVEVLQKAIELNPMLPESYAGLGTAFIGMGREDEAIGAIRRALAFAPNDFSSRATLGRAYFIGKGQLSEAAVEFEKALAVNPQAGWVALQLAQCYAYLGEYKRGEQVARQAAELQEQFLSGREGIQIVGAHSRLGHLYYLQGRYDDAISELYQELVFLRQVDHALRDRSAIEVNQRLVSAYARQGNREEAERAFEQVMKGFEARLQKGADEPFTRYYVACAYAMMGDKDKALECLEKAASSRRAYMVERAKREIDFESLRDDERFRKLIETV